MPNDDASTVTLTLRLSKALIAKLDAEAERRSVLAGAPGVVSRNVMARLIFEQVLDAIVPTSKPTKPRKPAPAATKALRKPPKGKVRKAKRSAPLAGKDKAKAVVSAEERELQ